MRASIVVVTDKPRGLELPINGLLGQVEQKGWEPKQEFDQERRQIVVRRKGWPTFKRFDPFELVVVDLMPESPFRAGELAMARRAAGRETTWSPARSSFNLTKFEFQYLARPGMSRWHALGEGIMAAKGEVVILMSDLVYPSPHFVAKHVQVHEEHKLSSSAPGPIGVSTVIEKKIPDNVEPYTSDLLGLLLDPDCVPQVAHSLWRELPLADDLARWHDLYPIHAASFSDASLEELYSPKTKTPAGWEISELFDVPWVPIVQPTDARLAEIDPTSSRLWAGPPEKGWMAGYTSDEVEESCAALRDEAQASESAPPDREPWWRRMFQ